MLRLATAAAALSSFASVASPASPSPSPSPQAQQCAFDIYNHTACTRNPYNQTTGTLADCCATCQADNQCQAFTLHDPHAGTGVGTCLYSLVAGPAAHSDHITCGTRAPISPSPGPSSSKIPHDFDCGIRRLALSYGSAIVASETAPHDLFEALQLHSDCGDAGPSPALFSDDAFATLAPRQERTHVVEPLDDGSGGSLDFWVSPEGDDSAAGTSMSTPWKSLARAVEALTHSEPATRPRTTIHLLPGMHTLNKTLALGPEHSGASAASPVVFRAEPNSTHQVVVSGGVDLSGLNWTKVEEKEEEEESASASSGTRTGTAAAVWKAQLPLSVWPSGVLGRVPSLFVASARQWKARWPNGDPETYCPRDRHGGNGCTGFAQASKSRVTHPVSCPAAVCALNAGAVNVFIHSAQSGEVIATGAAEPFDQVHNFTVQTPDEAFHAAPETWSSFQSFSQPSSGSTDPGSFQLERFDTSTTAAFWNSAVPSSMFAEQWTPREWKHPEWTTLHTYQSDYWGSWVFDVAAVDAKSKKISFSRGGFQEARGGSIGGNGGRGLLQDFFVAGAFEELDAEREFYHDNETATLYWVPNASLYSTPADLTAAEIIAPNLETLVRVGGRSGHAKWSPSSPSSSSSVVVANVRFENGIQFRHSAPTFMAPFEPTSGGDWAVHRGAAVVVEWASGITFDNCSFSSLEGNGLLMQHFVRNSTATRCTFEDIGETPLLFLGSVDSMNGTAGTQPWRNEFSHNYVRNWGIWGRQAAGYFEGLAGENNVSFNVFHDGPRAGANFNDGFGGGLVFEGNLIFNVVQDTGEHGSTNAWDRQQLLWSAHGDAASGELTSIPAPRVVARNFVFRNSFRGPTSNKWVLDKDDGSSSYDERANVLVYGAVKSRDGLRRRVRDNLFLFPNNMPLADTTETKVAMAFQVNGFEWDTFSNNTVVALGSDGHASIYSCTSKNDVPPNNTFGNTFYILDTTNSTSFYAGACGCVLSSKFCRETMFVRARACVRQRRWCRRQNLPSFRCCRCCCCCSASDHPPGNLGKPPVLIPGHLFSTAISLPRKSSLLRSAGSRQACD